MPCVFHRSKELCRLASAAPSSGYSMVGLCYLTYKLPSICAVKAIDPMNGATHHLNLVKSPTFPNWEFKKCCSKYKACKSHVDLTSFGVVHPMSSVSLLYLYI